MEGFNPSNETDGIANWSWYAKMMEKIDGMVLRAVEKR